MPNPMAGKRSDTWQDTPGLAPKRRNISHEAASERSRRAYETRRKNWAAQVGGTPSNPAIPIGETTKRKSGTPAKPKKAPVTTAQVRRVSIAERERKFWQLVVGEHQNATTAAASVGGVSAATMKAAKKKAQFYYVRRYKTVLGRPFPGDEEQVYYDQRQAPETKTRAKATAQAKKKKP